MLLELVEARNPILRQFCEEIVPALLRSSFVIDLIQSMKLKLYIDQTAWGLAAPQVGVPLPIFVARISGSVETFVNPRMICQSIEPTTQFVERCLSLPKSWGRVRRSKEVIVEALNQNGELFQAKKEGFPAILLQHEMDHTEGILFIDRPAIHRLAT